MARSAREVIEWEAPEHHHTPKGSDWFWAVGIVGAASTAVAIVFSNLLFATIILLGAIILIVAATRPPRTITHAISARGVRIGEERIPYSELESFHIDDEDPRSSLLFLKSERLLMPLIVLIIPEDGIDKIEDMLDRFLPQEHLEESLMHRALEFLGF